LTAALCTTDTNASDAEAFTRFRNRPGITTMMSSV
jgi:hypothetical protein